MSAYVDLLSLTWQPYQVTHFLRMDVWICLSMVFYAWAVQRNLRKILSLSNHLFSFRDLVRSKDTDGSKKSSRRFWNFSFLALSIVTVSWLVYAFWMYAGRDLPFGSEHGHDVQGGCSYLLCVCAVFSMLLYVFKGWVLWLVSHIFDEPRFGLFLWRMGISYDFLFSVFAFPFLMVSFYSDGWVQEAACWLSAVMFGIFFVIKVLKAVIVGRLYSRFSYLHIFAYFCALEILLSLSLWRIIFGL